LGKLGDTSPGSPKKLGPMDRKSLRRERRDECWLERSRLQEGVLKRGRKGSSRGKT